MFSLREMYAKHVHKNCILHKPFIVHMWYIEQLSWVDNLSRDQLNFDMAFQLK